MKLKVDSKFKRPKWNYKVFSTSNESKMKVQVVSNFILVNNEGTNCLLAQTGQMKLKVDSKFKRPKWRYKLFLTLNESEMKVQVVFNCIRVNIEGTSCLQAQTSRKSNYKSIPNSKRSKWWSKLFSTLNESIMKLQVVSNFNRVNNEGTSCLQAQTSQKWN